jgi:hypothetical protein
MSHTSFVQQQLPFTELDACPASSSLLSIGMLGDEGRYTMPRAILEALAGHLGGMVVEELPPFFVACKDGMALVLTVAVGSDFVGCAFMLPCQRLSLIDRHLDLLWARATKDQCSAELFDGTSFRMVGTANPIPSSVESCWRRSLA